jgi:hypothetical protein
MKLYLFQKIPLSRVRCTTVHLLLLLAIIFIAELSVIECCAATEPMAAADSRSPDDRFIHTVDQMLGTNWYGIYFQGNKVGYGKLISSREKGSSGVMYRFSLTAKITYYTIINTFAEGIEIVSVHGADGMPYTMSLGKLFEFRLEPEALAVKIDKPTDLFFRNLVRISIALGNPERVIRLKLGIDKASGALIGKAPGQTVESDIANGRYIVSNAPGGDPRITATFDEIQKNLAATTEIPINHPKVVSLAKEAVFGADTTAEKVARLVRFVQLYIEDDLSAEPLTLLDVIVRRKGDCSEHALLFTALARSLAIPCRMVAGLVYGGDTLRAFSPHAWNEVVVNGQWIPVDPTWGQTTIDATHLRFPASANDWYQVLGTVPNMKITVVDFEIK